MTKKNKESIEITYEITFKGNIEKINPKKLAQKLSGVTKKYLKDSGHHIDMKAFDVKYYTTDDIPVGKLDKLDELEKEILLKVAGANQERVARLEDMTGVIFSKRIGTYYSVNGWCIGHEYLAPLVEEEDNVALEAIKLLEEKGYKIVKK